jgi:transposase
MATKVKGGRNGKKRRSIGFVQAVLGKPSGVIQPRVQQVGPERFGIVSVDCAKVRSKWMFCDFYGKVLVPPTWVEHRRGDLQVTVAKLREAVQTYEIKDLIVCVEEMTGTYHQIVWRTFREAGYETRLVHPFASSHYRTPENGSIKTDDNDLIAIFRAGTNGFGLIEPIRDESYQSLQLLARHRRDLVSKRSRLQCQIRHHLERCLPGYTALFPATDLWDHAIGLTVLRFIAQRGGTHDALLEAGIPGVVRWLKEQRCAFQSRSVERIIAWAGDAAAGDPMAPILTRIWQTLLVDWNEKTRQITQLERDLAGLLAKTPWILLLSHPGINVVSAAELAGESGPIEHYASPKSMTGRAGLFPSRYQSDKVDRGGKLSRFRNAKLRAAWLLVADNLIKCNEYWRGKHNLWKSQGNDARDIRCRVANRVTRTVFHMVAGRKIYQHPSRLDRGYVMQKLLEFLRERETPATTILTILKGAADQLPMTARPDEAQLLSDIQRKAINSRRSEPQELGALLVHVLERLGVTSQPPTLNSTSLEAPEADASVSDR